MSFSFNFTDEDELDDDSLNTNLTDPFPKHGEERKSERQEGEEEGQREEVPSPCREWKLQQLLDNLPPRISYSPLKIPLDSTSFLTIYRRDLFDARFQELLNEDQEVESEEEEEDEKKMASKEDETAKESKRKKPAVEESSEASGNLASTTTDLIPGVYEGGFKTWECSLDLVATLEEYSRKNQGWIKGKSIVELGCGTALPSVYLLQKLFSLNQSDDRASPLKTVLHLCDFNSQVLRLVTLPNLILAWYFSPASESYRKDEESENQKKKVKNSKKATPTPPTPTQTPTPTAGEVSLSEGLLSAFLNSLSHHCIELSFFSGSWNGFNRMSSRSTSPSSSTSTSTSTSRSRSRSRSGSNEDRKENQSKDSQHRIYDLVLTCETIYSLKSTSELISVLKRSCSSSPPPATRNDPNPNPNPELESDEPSENQISTRLESTVLSPDSCKGPKSSGKAEVAVELDAEGEGEGEGEGEKTLCLVAAKVLYFGVGGGVEAFRSKIQQENGWVRQVRRIAKGVGRVVLKVGFYN